MVPEGRGRYWPLWTAFFWLIAANLFFFMAGSYALKVWWVCV